MSAKTDALTEKIERNELPYGKLYQYSRDGQPLTGNNDTACRSIEDILMADNAMTVLMEGENVRFFCTVRGSDGVIRNYMTMGGRVEYDGIVTVPHYRGILIVGRMGLRLAFMTNADTLVACSEVLAGFNEPTDLSDPENPLGLTKISFPWRRKNDVEAWCR